MQDFQQLLATAILKPKTVLRMKFVFSTLPSAFKVEWNTVIRTKLNRAALNMKTILLIDLEVNIM